MNLQLAQVAYFEYSDTKELLDFLDGLIQREIGFKVYRKETIEVHMGNITIERGA